MRTLEFKLRVIDGRTGIVETDIFIIQEPREVFKGYCGNTYIRVGGVYPGRKTLAGTVKGYVSYAEQSEWAEILL
jgi:hypothetical protein